ncbi:anthranilate phosphoribosyltransferase [Alkalihalobacillus sp. LMS39]|uniref:anthranilate phosphoribosyltransferase n=1 Tax=Alkalihalobacillus sp. LMS39 TaxID=2924032 RepID=UPI001FB527BA|nr:anthranilate phosphoribosyltransferase [Alkalihalobacillus sp. LMS39]UOE92336.1 anthranilate phosphoribosyltransferase [Alkalihalobacillus sp. LMS39]
MFKSILAQCISGYTMTTHEAKEVMDVIMNNEATPSQIASLLSIMRFRGETVEEMIGFALSMKEHAITIPHEESFVLDTCGTGGDNCHTFNISTASALVLSSLGIKVAKHGNRAVSSKSGSADVLEKMGIPIQTSPIQAVESLKEHNLCFLFAPLYHVAMKHAVMPRREIGFRTIFNLLGPLTNPANANAQLIGVYDTAFAEKMAQTLKEIGATKAMFVTGGEGLDELSITTHSDVVELNHGEIRRYQITPEEMGLTRGPLQDIQVETTEQSAKIIEEIFLGKANETATNIVSLNAGAALYLSDKASSIKEGVHLVRTAIQSGSIAAHYNRLKEKQEV